MHAPILLVDDEDGIRKVLGITLADMGYEVHTAKNGQEGLDIFRVARPPIVLTDIKMPTMDGIEFLRQIKAESPETEVIMITGHGDLDLAISALKLQASDFISKPINPDALEVSLARAWEKIEIRARMRNYTDNLEIMVQQQADRIIEFERKFAATQVVDGLTAAFKDLSGDMPGQVRFFNDLPCLVVIHSRGQKVASANPLAQPRLALKAAAPGRRA